MDVVDHIWFSQASPFPLLPLKKPNQTNKQNQQQQQPPISKSVVTLFQMLAGIKSAYPVLRNLTNPDRQ